MPCKACGKNETLEVCLGCGHSYCGMHRSDRGGAPMCKACLKEEAERTRKRKERLQAPAAEVEGSPAPVAVSVKAPAPLSEPGNALTPILVGLVVTALAASYLYWLGGRLVVDHELPVWSQTALTVLGSLFAFFGVWAIVKTKTKS